MVAAFKGWMMWPSVQCHEKRRGWWLEAAAVGWPWTWTEELYRPVVIMWFWIKTVVRFSAAALVANFFCGAQPREVMGGELCTTT